MDSAEYSSSELQLFKQLKYTMFSSKDEWKEGLSATQLDCIIALENEKQKLARERKDFQFQMESLQVELEKAKLNSEGTKREVQKFEREIEQANVKNDVLSKEVEKLNADLREKESLVLHLNQELNLTKAQRDKEKESKLGLEREIKSLTNTHVLDMDRLTDECCKFKEREEQETLERTSLKEELQAAVAKIAILNEDVSKITAERDLEKKERQILQTQVDENEKSFIEKFDKVYEENLQLREINDRAEERIKGNHTSVSNPFLSSEFKTDTTKFWSVSVSFILLQMISGTQGEFKSFGKLHDVSKRLH